MSATASPSLVTSAAHLAEHAATRALAEYGLTAAGGDSTSVRWAECEDELHAARHLTEDYDGQGAQPPPTGAVDLALGLAERLRARGYPPPDDCGAGVNGTIHLAWYRDVGSVEIEITSPTQVEGYRWRKGHERGEQFLLISAA
jgi:hypothetical protein